MQTRMSLWKYQLQFQCNNELHRLKERIDIFTLGEKYPMVFQVRKTKQSQGNESVLRILGPPSCEGSRKVVKYVVLYRPAHVCRGPYK